MSTLADRVAWNADGLVAALLQDRVSGQVLMQAWMNRAALAQTLDTGLATFWSRSRGEIWVKGATSGHTQAVAEVRLDCDGDSLLLLVDPAGPACHTGARSCFYRVAGADDWAEAGPPQGGVLGQLDAVMQARKGASAGGSYVASLYAAGRERILRKLGEEAIETVLAGTTGGPELVHEVADLWFHSLVLLADAGLTAQDVLEELGRRTGVSGLDEKAARADSAGRDAGD